jgi:deoxyribodipyrimidine photolyase-related protein
MLKHEAIFRHNPRMAIIYKQLDRLQDKPKLIAHAQSLLHQLDQL